MTARRIRVQGYGYAGMIYCVVPEALADELFDKLADYYKDDPNVTVIIDRRKSEGATAPDGTAGASARSATGGAPACRARSRRSPRREATAP